MLYRNVHNGLRKPRLTKKKYPIRFEMGFSKYESSPNMTADKITAEIRTRMMHIKRIINRLWKLKKGVNPKIIPKAIPPAICRGVTAELNIPNSFPTNFNMSIVAYFFLGV